MISLNRYHSLIEIVKTNYFILQSIKEIENGSLFLLKTILNVDRSKIAMYRSGIQLAQELQLDFVIKPIELIESEDRVSILYQQFDAISLREYLNRNKKLKINTRKIS